MNKTCVDCDAALNPSSVEGFYTQGESDRCASCHNKKDRKERRKREHEADRFFMEVEKNWRRALFGEEG